MISGDYQDTATAVAQDVGVLGEVDCWGDHAQSLLRRQVPCVVLWLMFDVLVQDEPEAVSTPTAATAATKAGPGAKRSTAAEAGQNASASTARPVRSRLAKQTSAAGKWCNNGLQFRRPTAVLSSGHQESKDVK